MTEYPEYVLCTDLLADEAAILRRRPKVSSAVVPGEYEAVANGTLSKMRQLFTDLTGGKEEPDPDPPVRCAEVVGVFQCTLDRGHTGPHQLR